MLILFSFLQLLDLLSTYLAINQGKTEANPLLAKLFKKMGVLQILIPFKAIVVGGMFYLWNEQVEYIWEILLAMNILYSVVVINNIKQLRN